MRPIIRKPLAAFLAVLLVAGAVGGAASLGMVDNTDELSPVGDAQALACGGLCIAGIAGATAIAGGAIGAKYFSSDTNYSALKAADADETEENIYSQAVTQRQNNAILQDSLSNYLQDTSSIAKMEGKAAYIRALENGSSEAQARIAARNAVEDYYATKQIQLANSYGVSAKGAGSIWTTLQSSNVNLDYVYATDNAGNPITDTDGDRLKPTGTYNDTVTLVNGSSHQTTKIYLSAAGNTLTHNVSVRDVQGSGMEKIYVSPPTSSFNKSVFINNGKFVDLWSEIETQNTNVQNEIDTFVSATYDSYESGDINSSDLVDPYLGAREYSPEGQYGSFTLRSLSSLGVSPPENLSSIGTMTVEDLETGETYQGVLMSEGLPSSGSFDTGTNYNASQLAGPQFVVSRDTSETHDLTGEFRVENATTFGGENVSSIDYNQIDYDTTNLTEYEQLNDRLQNLTAEINSRQQKLRSGGGGGLFGGAGGIFGIGLSDAQVGGVFIVLILLALGLVTRS